MEKIPKIELASYPMIYFENCSILKKGDVLLSHLGSNEPENPDQWYFCCQSNGNDLNPEYWIKNGVFVKVNFVGVVNYRHKVEINEVYPIKNIFSELIKRNTYFSTDPHLEKLGINQKLVDMISIDHHFFGIIEICSCGIPECYSRKAWIIKKADRFIIPFMYSFASPHDWLELGIDDLKPEYDPLQENSWDNPGDLKERIPKFDSVGDVIEWKRSMEEEPYPLSAFNAGFQVSHEDVFPINPDFFEKLGIEVK